VGLMFEASTLNEGYLFVVIPRVGLNVKYWCDLMCKHRLFAAVNCFCKFVSINSGFCAFHRVDIMVQPSWTWGPVGPLEFDTDAFRAVENGFTLLRCSSVGVSGVVSPFYRVLEYRCMQTLAP